MTKDALIMKGPLVLQNCTMSLEDHRGSCNETSVTSPNSAHDICIKVEEGIDVDTTQQMIPVPISFPPVKAEQYEVSYVSASIFRHISPISGNACCPLLPPSIQHLHCGAWKFLSFGLCESIAR